MSSRRTISNTFTVTTMDDPVSVQAQYSPDKVTVHTTWQEGDLYMRTRESDESAWSSWHKIVGESGDKTDFSFGISEYKTTANASTAPSDISSWSDAPLAVTTAKPYLWAKVQQKSWNASTQAYVVDSTRYIRLTGEDGYTVEAQYAPNNNPSASQIHTTWQDGDLYMRTKQSNETTWSSWHKIVGESGDETDYTFNISKSLTSSSATTAPANCYYNTWQDAPIAPTSTYPYLWMKIVKKTWNESTQSYDSGTARYARITGEPGTSPYFADLDNEMDSVACDANGNAAALTRLYTLISVFHGTDDITDKCKVQCTSANNTTGGTVQLVSSRTQTTAGTAITTEQQMTSSLRYIRVAFAQGDGVGDSTTHRGTVILTITHTTYGTRTIVFTVNGVLPGANGEHATVYSLLPDQTQISVGRSGSGYVPSTASVVCGYTKSVGGAITEVADERGQIDGKYYIYFRKHERGGGWSGMYRRYGYYAGRSESSTSLNSIMNFSTAKYDAVELILCTATANTSFNVADIGNYVVVDRETIPVVADGNKGDTGDSAPEAFASPEKITIQCYSNGNVKASSTTSVIFTLKVGTNSGTVTSVSSGTKPNGVTVTGGADNAVTITVGTTATASGLSAGVTFTVTGTYDGKTYSATVTVALIGSTQGEQGDPGSPGGTGPRGKIGRFFYYAGEFDSSNTTQTFVVNDAQAPYFSHGVNAATGLMNCHVYNPTANGTFTMAQMWANSSQSWNNAPWEVMNNLFKYLITEALFTKFAKLASAIFSGDWMLSQYGVPSRVISTTEKNLVYTCVKVDGQYPVSDLATLLDDSDLWEEYKDYGYSDSELETVADICKWAVSVMPSNSDDVRYNAIQTVSSTSYQLFGINPSNLFSVFSPNISLDFLHGKAYLNDCNIKGNLVGRVSNPLTRIKNGSVWGDYGVKTRDDYGYTRHYLFINRMPTWNVQIEYMSGAQAATRRLILPVITSETLGTEIKVVNVSGDTITVEGKPESSTYAAEGSYLLDGIQITGYSNDLRTIEMETQTMLKFVSVEIPTQNGEYGWIADGEPQTIKSLV